jgi:acetolactate synthase regulatory subunit
MRSRPSRRLTGIPVITTLMGIGAYPGGEAQSLGMPGMHGTVTANRAISHCDLIVGAGLRFDDRVTGKLSRFAPNATIVHIDIDPAEISKLVKAHVPVVGDLRDVLPRLTELLGPLDIGDWWTQLNAWKASYPERYKTDKPLVSQEVIAHAGARDRRRLHRHHRGRAAPDVRGRLFPTNRPRTWISSGGLGTMGFGLPAAIGAAFARPGRPVVCVAGDGSVQMNIQELATVYKHQLPIVIAICNNGMLGMVRQWQEMFHAQRYSEVYLADSNPDFAKLAEAYGIAGYNVFDRETAAKLVPEVLASKKPALINFVVYESEKVFPMVPAGAGVDEMIIGDQEPDEAEAAVGMSVRRHVLSVTVRDQPGVLVRIAALFARRGYNIESLSVAQTHEPGMSRTTFVVTGEDAHIEQMQKQLQKLIDVIKVIDHSEGPYVDRELMLIKVAVRNPTTASRCARSPRTSAPASSTSPATRWCSRSPATRPRPTPSSSRCAPSACSS